MNKKNKNRILITLLVLAVIPIVLSISGYPIVISSDTEKCDEVQSLDDDLINPLKGYDLGNGHWEIYLNPSFSEEIDERLSSSSLLYTDDLEIINEIKESFDFRVSGGDMATVDSQILFYCDGDLILKYGITLESSSVGLQSKCFGWAKALYKEKLLDLFGEFEKVNLPLVFL